MKRKKFTQSQNSITRAVGIFLVIGISVVIIGILVTPIVSEIRGSLMDGVNTIEKPILHTLRNPHLLIEWSTKWVSRPSLRFINTFLNRVLVILLCLVIAVPPIMMIINRWFRRTRKNPDVHGSSRWCNYKEICQAGLINKKPNGIYLGAWEDPKTKKEYYLTADSDTHVLAYAPTRSGKGVGLVIPTLLSWRHSLIVFDIKSELHSLTSGWRKIGLKNAVLKFDPTCNDDSGVSFNPLWEVRLGTDFETRDVQLICEILTNPSGTQDHNHWVVSAKSLLVGAILHVLYYEKDKSLCGVANFLSDPNRSADETYQFMLTAVHDCNDNRGWIDRSTGKQTRSHPVCSSVAQSMIQKSEDEKSGILSTAISFLDLYRDVIIAKNTERSDFSILDLMNHEKPVSLYLCCPPSDLDRTRPFLRLFLSLISTRLLERLDYDNGRSVSPHKHRLLLMLDEFAALKKIESFHTALSYMAAYGIQAYLIAQDLSQITAAYGKDESIVSNCHTRIVFAPNKIETADVISRMVGHSTVQKTHNSVSGRRTDVFLHNVSEGQQEVGRPLKAPDETMKLPDDECLIFVGNLHTILGKKIKYYEDPVFKERSKIPPPEISDKIGVTDVDTKFSFLYRADTNNSDVSMKAEHIKHSRIDIDFQSDSEKERLMI